MTCLDSFYKNALGEPGEVPALSWPSPEVTGNHCTVRSCEMMTFLCPA